MEEKDFFSIQSQLALPFQATPEEHLEEIFKVLELKFHLKKNSKQKFVDIGSGNGQVIFYSARYYGIRSYGIEINPDLVEETRERLTALRNAAEISKENLTKIKFEQGNVTLKNLKKYDYIYIFSLPKFTPFLKKCLNNTKKDAIVIVYKYPLNQFEDFLKLEHQLDFNEKEIVITTFFYRKVVIESVS